MNIMRRLFQVGMHPPSSTTVYSHHSSWRRLAPKYVNLNKDATWKMDQQCSGIGYIVHDIAGQPLLAVFESSSFLSPTIGEALALQSGISMVIQARGFPILRLNQITWR
ncbi:hypothetical protein NE237_020317 [Protea cynaroides]|uniref:Uncharacterized protein n=1 Tax=Protea cynaroides TaxID=273540 RepID=A0A9Q0K2H0_9MAGN|nr:hypothetical protein NE237_020317 [Protea cynaroides]